MSEKQVFVCLILSQACFPRSSRNRGEGAGEEKPWDGPWSTPSSGPPKSDFPVPSLGSRVCLTWGSEGSSGKGRKRKLPVTKWHLAPDPKISAPSKVNIPGSLSPPVQCPPSGLPATSLPPPLHSVAQELSTKCLRWAGCQPLVVKKVLIVIWRFYSSGTYVTV